MKQPSHQWQAVIRQAPTEEAVLAQVRLYLGTLSAEEIARLPQSARPVPLERVDDLMAFNVQVARDELMCAGNGPPAAVLREMSLILNEASGRLASMSLDRPP